jgi:hypothetical protein
MGRDLVVKKGWRTCAARVHRCVHLENYWVFGLFPLSSILGTREHNETVHQLFVDFKKAYDSVSREVLYNILIVWDTHEIS